MKVSNSHLAESGPMESDGEPDFVNTTSFKIHVKKEIKKQVKIAGSHYGTVQHALKIQFPSLNIDEWKAFIENEFTKKYNNVK
jgi:hypothetical protein